MRASAEGLKVTLSKRTRRYDVYVRREDTERFVEEVRGDDPVLASYLRIEERELEAGGLN